MSDDPLSSPRHHPDEATLLAHVAGGLGEAHRLLIATHLAGCARCRGEVAALEAAAGELLFGLQPTPPIAGARSPEAPTAPPAPRATPARVEPASRVFDDVVLPPVLGGLRPGRVRWLGPGIRHVPLLRNRHGVLHLLRVRAGIALPQHSHRGLELTCVLAGAFTDRGEHYGVGDMAEASEDADHAPVAHGTADCICIISTDGRLRFRGWLGRLLQPFLPF